ncbi:uncharacterized protein KQ657_004489 [Scheffersomyces spartinae]|uniref:Family A G protein-coupled receptor-like protein n=1 Tax=Scheffersomyces spartinae TaxID=45513 RepID=A0A9P7VBM0_9ASCO|nr:uncharacterized protein KQ657_004489 [Scheffersomyces spartinae]KAG7194808.1 hypothetical protein KQ657_004489 [Scheffersomyces spartinae]
MGLAWGAMYGVTSNAKPIRKISYMLPFLINVIMIVAYFTYASNLGYTSIPVEFHHVSTSRGLGVRQIFYSKFVAWFLAWPAVIFGLSILTDTFSSTTALFSTKLGLFQNMFAKVLGTWVFVIGLLIGALIKSSYKWGYFTFAVFAQLFAMGLICYNYVDFVKNSSGSKKPFVFFVVMMHMLVWLLYPVCWGLSEGGNVIKPTSEAVFYGILDLINFGCLPTITAYLNAQKYDEFADIVEAQTATEKIPASPRHSGDTAA